MGLPLVCSWEPRHAYFTLTSSGQITSLKLRRSSGSEKLMSQVLGRFSSLMSGFGQQREGEKTGERKAVGLGRCQQNSQVLLDLLCGVLYLHLSLYYTLSPLFSLYMDSPGYIVSHIQASSVLTGCPSLGTGKTLISLLNPP